MPVLSQALFTLVGCHLVFLPFLSTWHRIFFGLTALRRNVEQKLFQVLEIGINLCLYGRIPIHGFYLFKLCLCPFFFTGVQERNAQE